MTLILFILIFGVVVVSHEFGHFLVAKLNGIHVVEFSVGMGPNLVSFTKGDTKYSLKLLPIGGACMFEGEDGVGEENGEPSEGSFNRANVWARIATVFAGPFFNFILGLIVAIIMVNLIHITLPTVAVSPGSAAEEAGLMDDDTIVALNGEKIYLFSELSLFNHLNGGKSANLTYERDGELYDTVITPKWDEATGRYMLGVACNKMAEERGIHRVKYAFYEMRFCVIQTYKGLLNLVQGQVKSEELAGPVGIAVNVVGKTYEETKEYGFLNVFVNMLNIVLLLTINLGILNLLPIPALDGGRLLFLFVEVVRGKPIPPEKEGMIHFAGLVFFMGLMVFVLFNDLRNIFG